MTCARSGHYYVIIEDFQTTWNKTNALILIEKQLEHKIITLLGLNIEKYIDGAGEEGN